MAGVAPKDRRRRAGTGGGGGASSAVEAKEEEDKGLRVVSGKEEEGTRSSSMDSSSVEAREEEGGGHMARALKGLTHAMSALAKSKFGSDPSSDDDEDGDSSSTPFAPSEPSREEKRSGLVMHQHKRVHVKKKKKKEQNWGEEPAERVLICPPVPEAEMLYQRTPLPQHASKKKKKAPLPVPVQPSTPALDASKEKQQQQQPVVPTPPSSPDFAEAAMEAYWARRKKEMETEPEESRTDVNAYQARLYRKFWNDSYADEECASYEDTTSIPPMCFTDSSSAFAGMEPSMQVFSVKIEQVMGGLGWPLDVYGVVAVRDVVDHKRNIIFYRERDSCQTINSEDPYLALTGPTRAVVMNVHPTYFEVDLKVKGPVESEDIDFSLLAVCYTSIGPSRSCVLTRVETSKISTMRFTFGHILNAVESTICVELLNGDWPSRFQKGAFTAKTASLNAMDIPLLAFSDGKLPLDGGKVKLSRRVISVELISLEEEKLKAKLMVCVKALHASDKNAKVEHHLSFKPKSRGRSHRTIKIDSCEMRVTVAWSLLSTFRCSYEKVIPTLT